MANETFRRIDAALEREDRAAQALLERMLDLAVDEDEDGFDALDYDEDPVEAYARYPFSLV